MIRVAYCVGEYPEVERQRRIDVAMSYASEEVEVGIIPIEATPYHGLNAASIQGVHPIVHKAYVQAEKEGYDAVVPLGMLDLGVDGGRALVDIPVIGPAQACLHIAAMVGERFGLICYQRPMIARHRSQIRSYGMDQFVVGYRTVSMPIKEMADNRDQLTETFVAKARELIDNESADVIIPHGISQCPVHIDPGWLSKELGVPVVEGIGAPIRLAAMLAGLGLSQSRVRWPKASLPEGA